MLDYLLKLMCEEFPVPVDCRVSAHSDEDARGRAISSAEAFGLTRVAILGVSPAALRDEPEPLTTH
ncbi:TPA: hypothetical protein ACU9T0_006035 [Burkholderia cenocepacia]|uniref:Uncharacterized protein n=1 Tax=Burkholderia vietnamiensis TaxID=60552 RepID=A0ABS1AXJ5_BURVI|nr:hypothetical protein [Burkholderia vietnamiensis]MBJ9688808.1 hypothetical protein [Burkholderia vietnamiensis]